MEDTDSSLKSIAERLEASGTTADTETAFVLLALLGARKQHRVGNLARHIAPFVEYLLAEKEHFGLLEKFREPDNAA